MKLISNSQILFVFVDQTFRWKKKQYVRYNAYQKLDQSQTLLKYRKKYS